MNTTGMNLQLVPENPWQVSQTLTCKCCGEPKARGEIYADLNGKAFVDYYCQSCIGDAK